MPKPADMPEDLYRRMCEAYDSKASTTPDYTEPWIRKVAEIAKMEPGLIAPSHREMTIAGWYLWERLHQTGASKGDLELIGWSLGQRIFPEGVKEPDPWAVAQTLYEQYMAGGDEWEPELN